MAVHWEALKAATALGNNKLSAVQSLLNQHETYKTLYYAKNHQLSLVAQFLARSIELDRQFLDRSYEV